MRLVTLVLGGARSGKSRHAEALASRHRGPKSYIATAQALDDEMLERIAQHRKSRGDAWTTYEEPLALVETIMNCRETLLLVDCITLWISNLMHAGRPIEQQIESLCAALQAAKSRVILVSNEVGQGIVPDNALARAFRDQQGFANQRLAEVADEVVFVTAGLPLMLKRRSPRQASPRTAKTTNDHRG